VDAALARVAQLADAVDVAAADEVVRAAAVDAAVRVVVDAAARAAAADVTVARVAHATERADVMADVATVDAAKAAASSSRT